MGMNAVTGAQLMCSFGLAPTVLNVLPTARVMIEGRPAADIRAMTPANIPTFGMCTTITNPAVAATTASALGTLTPAPCLPVVTGPWTPLAPTVQVAGSPALVSGATCVCAYGGVITMAMPGAVRTTSS